MSKMTQRGTVVMPTPWDNVLINFIFGEMAWFQYELGVITFRPTPRSGSGWNLPSHVGGIKSFHLHFRGVKSTPVVPRYCYICNYLVSVGLFVPVDLFLLITSLKHVQNDPERYRCNADAVGNALIIFIFGEITWFQYELGVITFRPTPEVAVAETCLATWAVSIAFFCTFVGSNRRRWSQDIAIYAITWFQ